MKPILTRINQQLKAMGIEPRFVRGRGYYYVTGVAVSSSLYVCWLNNESSADYRMAVAHVNEVLREEGLAQFQVR